MDFGVMFFSSVDRAGAGKYDLLVRAARFADAHGFSCVRTPERHFHPFDGLFPNPALTSAALTTVTSHIQLQAGSLISPLHHTERIAEAWSVADDLAGGRTAMSVRAVRNGDDVLL